MSKTIALRLLFTVTLVMCAVASTFAVSAWRRVQPETSTVFGVTFSPRTMTEYGGNPREAYTAVLDDLEARHIRLPLFWNEIEPVDDVYAFAETDWYLDEAAKRGAMVTLAVGMKTPRWPECHIPEWAADDVRAPLLDYLEAIVTRYKDHPALFRWQVENEPHFPFGDCPPFDAALFADELALIRAIDGDTPLQLTVSGEQEPWAASAGQADVLGVSLYRFAWNADFGLVAFPHPASFYALQRTALGDSIDTAVISELQAEPWFVGERPVDVDDAYALFTAERLRDHMLFAQETSFPEAYLWGVEWWYALRMKGEARLWETAKEFIE